MTEADDGWSGTNFERPAWRRMISDIEHKRVNMVIAKDLSRLGRDYISTGQYTELYFPAKGVRCIAANDGFDTAGKYTEIAPFKNILNEMYARDISKKIRSALQTKRLEGAFIGNFAPYGYEKDPADKNHLIVDCATAPVVRQVFKMAESGSPPAAIANHLNCAGIMTPAVYKAYRSKKLLSSEDIHKTWTSSMICKMLSNSTYLGHVVQGKSETASFKSSVTLRKPKSEWVIAQNMHAAIVTPETFERVRNRCVSRRNAPKTGFTNIFSGIAKCADCGRGMSTVSAHKSSEMYNLVCGGYKLHGREACTNHFIGYNVLYNVVLRELKNIIAPTYSERLEIFRALEKLASNMNEREENETIKALLSRDAKLDRIIKQLYEDYADGGLEKARFKKMLDTYQAEHAGIEARIAALERRTANSKQSLMLFNPNDSIAMDIVPPKLLRLMISKIEVCQGSFEHEPHKGRKHESIRIFYRFAAG